MTKSNRRNLESALAEAGQALNAARSELVDLQRANKNLEARLGELGGELERRPPETAGATSDEATNPDPKFGDALAREWQLARRVAELEASRRTEPPTGPGPDVRELTERIDTLTLQLHAARAREDELAARAVHAERTLAETGSRLADLAERADQVDGLEASLAELRDASALAESEAREQIEAIRAELADAAVRATGLELDLAESQAATAAAQDTAALAETQRSAAETRLSAIEAELASTTAILTHLEEVFAAVRDRVDHPRSAPPEPLAGPEPVMETPSAVRYLDVNDVVAIAERVDGPGAPSDLTALDGVVAAPASLDEHGEPLFPDLLVKAAVLLTELIRQRPYLLGNRRIAQLASMRFLELNGLDVINGEDALSELALAVEAGDVPVLSVAATLETLTVPHANGTEEIEPVRVEIGGRAPMQVRGTNGTQPSNAEEGSR
jgi:prophage maintenance system killer protein